MSHLLEVHGLLSRYGKQRRGSCGTNRNGSGWMIMCIEAMVHLACDLSTSGMDSDYLDIHRCDCS